MVLSISVLPIRHHKVNVENAIWVLIMHEHRCRAEEACRAMSNEGDALPGCNMLVLGTDMHIFATLDENGWQVASFLGQDQSSSYSHHIHYDASGAFNCWWPESFLFLVALWGDKLFYESESL